ncbi:hypothetical protein BH10ACT11_BH10ACT11_09020 [soil metagenome]
MKKMIITASACLAVSLSFASLGSAANETSAAHAKNVAAKQCAAEKKADKAAFEATYGKHAMRNCVKGTTDEVKAESKGASKDCADERAADPQAFKETYGKHGLGKCVSAKVAKDSKAEVKEFKGAAKECKAERADDPQAFHDTYGSGHNGRNALGKCVSQKSQGDADRS